ncbi:MAG: hypothetical protein B7Y25_02370 [Alphaproteobacteria bacterium 16-39-46]|nr:MAG: hypothetical protein B7Y25_02370 [Alphaproteobacteria bacterium 16-39-46]OZA43589.1 MAG: hypothetical protein B7X84_02765 [Alphaproteobacteria bacterium 17-39-52]HQS83760.1 DUF2000 domain-containing protein [Alphaproteobacteria bacterium]HQS93530.1 DUF2000 domain-containing protein [Alphaproteobacteria bacterium]
MSFENKLVALVNKDIEIGVAMNAVAHMTLGFGSEIKKELLRLNDYEDKDGNLYPNISQMPFMILRGKSNEIRKAVQASKEQHIKFGVFLNTMTGGTYQEQLDNTKQTSEEQLIYYGAVLFGPWEAVSLITKRFSLYRG